MGFFTTFGMTNSGELKRGPHRKPVLGTIIAEPTVYAQTADSVRVGNVAGAQCVKIKNLALMPLF